MLVKEYIQLFLVTNPECFPSIKYINDNFLDEYYYHIIMYLQLNKFKKYYPKYVNFDYLPLSGNTLYLPVTNSIPQLEDKSAIISDGINLIALKYYTNQYTLDTINLADHVLKDRYSDIAIVWTSNNTIRNYILNNYGQITNIMVMDLNILDKIMTPKLQLELKILFKNLLQMDLKKKHNGEFLFSKTSTISYFSDDDKREFITLFKELNLNLISEWSL